MPQEFTGELDSTHIMYFQIQREEKLGVYDDMERKIGIQVLASLPYDEEEDILFCLEKLTDFLGVIVDTKFKKREGETVGFGEFILL